MYKYEYSVYVYYIDSHVTRTCNTHATLLPTKTSAR